MGQILPGMDNKSTLAQSFFAHQSVINRYLSFLLKVRPQFLSKVKSEDLIPI